jgi:hypothetical protein
VYHYIACIAFARTLSIRRWWPIGCDTGTRQLNRIRCNSVAHLASSCRCLSSPDIQTKTRSRTCSSSVTLRLIAPSNLPNHGTRFAASAPTWSRPQHTILALVVSSEFDSSKSVCFEACVGKFVVGFTSHGFIAEIL